MPLVSLVTVHVGCQVGGRPTVRRWQGDLALGWGRDTLVLILGAPVVEQPNDRTSTDMQQKEEQLPNLEPPLSLQQGGQVVQARWEAWQRKVALLPCR